MLRRKGEQRKKKEKEDSFLDLGAPLQGYQAARSRSVDDLPSQGQQKSINVNRREIETFRGWIGPCDLYAVIDRAWIINSDLEHLLRLATGSRRADIRAGMNIDRPGVISVHKSSSFPNGPVRGYSRSLDHLASMRDARLCALTYDFPLITREMKQRRECNERMLMDLTFFR